MKKLTLVVPNVNDLVSNTTDLSLYNYNFEDFSLVPIQEVASMNVYKKISKSINENISSGKMFEKLAKGDDFEYVAKLSDSIKEKIKTNEYSLVVEKITGETKATLRNNINGEFVKGVNLDKRYLKDLGNLPELAAMQNQLADIAKQLENLSYNIGRIEQGQYNDRYSGFFSTRQLLLESLSIENKDLQRQILSAAIQSSNETIGKLMLTLRQDANEFLDYKLKPKEVSNLENKINESLSYLNSTVQLNFIAYTILEEPKALLSALSNYKSFLDQTLLTPLGESTRSVAWKIDNAKEDDSAEFNTLTKGISGSINNLLTDNLLLELEE